MWGRAGEYALKVSYLTEQRPSCGDSKASPDTPDQTTDDGQNFVTKELRDKLSESEEWGRWGGTDWGERNDEEDGDWYEPTIGQTVASMRRSDANMGHFGVPMHPIGGGLNGGYDLVMIKDEEGADDDGDDAKSVIHCIG